MHTTRIPPVDPAPATITAVLAMHAGHICPSSELLIRPRLSALPVSSLPFLLRRMLPFRCVLDDRVHGGQVQILMQESNGPGVTNAAGFRWSTSGWAARRVGGDRRVRIDHGCAPGGRAMGTTSRLHRRRAWCRYV